MAPKTTANPAKLNQLLSYFHSSGVAHSIKDLEKALPSVASINSMQVKDYLSALADDNKIHVEKIGSVNWYWAFASEEKRALETQVEGLMGDVGKAQAAVQELKGKLEKARAAQAEDENEGAGEKGLPSKEELMRKKAAMEVWNSGLRKERTALGRCDLGEIERKRCELGDLKVLVARWSEGVEAMEDYLMSRLGADKAAMEEWKRQMYGQEFDEETSGLKDLGV